MVTALIFLLGLGSLLFAVVVAVRRWEDPKYRAGPFVCASILSLIWFWGDSFIELVKHLIVLNCVAGGFLFFAWLQWRQK